MVVFRENVYHRVSEEKLRFVLCFADIVIFIMI